MRTPLVVAALALVACTQTKSTLDTGAPEPAIVAPPPTPDPPKPVAVAPLSSVTPPTLDAEPKEPSKPTKVPTYKTDFTEVTLEGTYFPPEEEKTNPDDGGCEALRLDGPIRVVNDKTGANADPRAKGGVTTRVCLHHFKEPEHWGSTPFLQRNSHVKVKGTVSGPFARFHPSAIIMMDVVLLGASPPATPIPPEKFPDGATVGYVRRADEEKHEVALDVVFLYYGEDAERMAAARKKKLPPGQFWFIVNDSNQLRTATLAKGVRPQKLRYENGGGWTSIDMNELQGDADRWARGPLPAASGSPPPPNVFRDEEAPFMVHVKNGIITEDKYGYAGLRRINFSR